MSEPGPGCRRIHLQGYFGDQLEVVTPAAGVEPSLPGEHGDQVGGEFSVFLTCQDVPQSGVQYWPGPLEHVEEQHHPRVAFRRVGQVLQESRGQHPYREEHELNVVVAARPGAEGSAQPVGGPGRPHRAER